MSFISTIIRIYLENNEGTMQQLLKLISLANLQETVVFQLSTKFLSAIYNNIKTCETFFISFVITVRECIRPLH